MYFFQFYISTYTHFTHGIISLFNSLLTSGVVLHSWSAVWGWLYIHARGFFILIYIEYSMFFGQMWKIYETHLVNFSLSEFCNIFWSFLHPIKSWCIIKLLQGEVGFHVYVCSCAVHHFGDIKISPNITLHKHIIFQETVKKCCKIGTLVLVKGPFEWAFFDKICKII